MNKLDRMLQEAQFLTNGGAVAALCWPSGSGWIYQRATSRGAVVEHYGSYAEVQERQRATKDSLINLAGIWGGDTLGTTSFAVDLSP